MGRQDFWTSDWFLGVIVALAVAWVSQAELGSLERTAYDLGERASSRNASERIAFVAIDAPGIANIGRWSRSQDLDAQPIQKLALMTTHLTWVHLMTTCVLLLIGHAALTKRFLVMERGKAAGKKIACPSDLFSLNTAWMSIVDVAS